MKKIMMILFNFCGCCCTGPYAQSYRAMGGIGLGAYSLNHTDLFSVITNPASLARLKNFSVAVYAERRFLLKELNYYTAVAGLPAHSGDFCLQTVYSGSSDYNTTQLSLLYGRKLGGKMDIGARFNYHGIRISSYGSASAISFELGTMLHVTEKLHAGVHINNPSGGRFGKESQEKLPSVYTLGLGYDASEKFFAGIEIEKEEDQPVNVKAGIEYKFIPQLLVRAGISSAMSSAWLGIGLALRSFRLDITSSYHSQLGITPGLSVLFKPDKNEK